MMISTSIRRSCCSSSIRLTQTTKSLSSFKTASAACVPERSWTSCKTVNAPVTSRGLTRYRRDAYLRTSSRRVQGFGAGIRIPQLRSMSSDISQKTSKELGADPDSKLNNVSPSASKIDAPQILSKLNPINTSATERKENIYTIPNILTASRLIAVPGICYAILNSHPYLGLGLFAYAGITDLIDGYLARRYNSQTVLGTILDPMADKTLMTGVVICLTIQGLIPTWLAVIILGRDIALAISAIYFRWISLPPPKTFTRYWDFSLPSAEVRPTEISKINTFLQLLLVGNAMVLPALPEVFVQTWNLYGMFEGWQYLVAGTTVWSGLSYVFSKDAVKILSKEEVQAKQAGERNNNSIE